MSVGGYLVNIFFRLNQEMRVTIGIIINNEHINET
jgi:hypothetical protein